KTAAHHISIAIAQSASLDQDRRDARSPSPTAATEISAIIWAPPQYYHQIAWSRRARVGVADSAGNDYRRFKGAIAAAQRGGGRYHLLMGKRTESDRTSAWNSVSIQIQNGKRSSSSGRKDGAA